jgi:hypothetical protein
MEIFKEVVSEFRKFILDYNKSKNSQGYYSHLATQGEVPEFLVEYELQDKQEGTSLPYFSTGTEVANILDYEFDVPKSLLLAVQNRQGDLNSALYWEYQTNRSSVIDKFVSVYEEYYKNTGVVLSNKSEDFIRDLIEKSLNTFFSKDPKGYTLTSEGEELAAFYYLNMMRELGGSFLEGDDTGFAIRAVITTVPMFNLSDTSDLNRGCIISIRNNPRPYQNLDIATLSESFYSGVYKILGIQHVVNGTKPHSIFTVVKIAPLVFNKKSDN